MPLSDIQLLKQKADKDDVQYDSTVIGGALEEATAVMPRDIAAYDASTSGMHPGLCGQNRADTDQGKCLYSSDCCSRYTRLLARRSS